jgi:hypothetical protein
MNTMKMKKARFYIACGVLAFNAATACAAQNDMQNDAQQKIGDSTLAWFAIQADGSAAGNAAPMSGVEASAAYARYLKSFENPIPDHFGSTVKDSSAGTSSGG